VHFHSAVSFQGNKLCVFPMIDNRSLRPDTMAPRKETKAPSEGSSQNTDILFDTSPRRIDIVKSWMQVFNMLQYELVNFLDDSSDDETKDLATKYKIVSQSELHKIETRSRLLPYNDMISWVLDNVDIPTRTIFNSQKVAVVSFQPKHIQVMYKLSPVSNFVYNASFLVDFDKKECAQYGKNLPDLIKDLYSRTEKFILFIRTSHNVYSNDDV
jgi:hypothetical protein